MENIEYQVHQVGNLAVEKMMEYTKGEGCGDHGDYLSWEEMEWNFHGEAKIEHMETEEICTMPGFNLYSAAFEMKSCMHFCQNLGGSRVPPVTSSLQLERVGSFLRKTDLKSQYYIWISIHDEEKEGKWRDFYNHQGLNFTPPWFGNEPNGGTSENCASIWENRLFDITCKWSNIVFLCVGVK